VKYVALAHHTRWVAHKPDSLAALRQMVPNISHGGVGSRSGHDEIFNEDYCKFCL